MTPRAFALSIHTVRGMEPPHVWVLFFEADKISVIQPRPDGTFDVYNAVDGVPSKVVKVYLSAARLENL